MDTQIMLKIVREVSANISVKVSKIKYNKEYLQFRKSIEQQWYKYRKHNPFARLDVPTDINGL